MSLFSLRRTLGRWLAPTPRRVAVRRLQVEALEDRTLLSGDTSVLASWNLLQQTTAGGVFGPTNVFPPPALPPEHTLTAGSVSIEILSYSWSMSAPEGSSAQPGVFQVTADAGGASALFAASAAGTQFPSVRLATHASGVEYLAYTLSGVRVASYTLGALQPGNTLPPVDFSLEFNRIDVTFLPETGPPISASWNVNLGQTSGGRFGPSNIPTGSQPEHTLIEGANSIELTHFNWSMRGLEPIPGGGFSQARLQSFTVVTDITGSSALFASAAQGTRFSSLRLETRRSDGSIYLIYNLTNVAVTSYQVTSLSGSAPVVTFDLDFDRIDTEFRPAAGGPLLASWNLATQAASGGVFGPTTLGGVHYLTQGGVNLEIFDYSWGMNGQLTGSPASANTFQLTTDVNGSALLFAAAASGTLYSSIRVATRTGLGADVLIYTLQSASVRSYALADDDQGASSAPLVTFSLGFDRISSEYLPPTGPAVTASWNLSAATTTGGRFGPSTTTSPNPPGHTLTEGTNNIEVESYSWDMVGRQRLPGGGTTQPQAGQFRITTSIDGGSALFASAARGQSFASVILTSRNATGATYLRYTLSNAQVASYSLMTDSAELIPRLEFTLQVTSMQAEFFPPTGPSVIASWNIATGMIAGGAFGPNNVDPSSTLAQTLTVGVTSILVNSFSWGMARPTGGSAESFGIQVQTDVSGSAALFALAAAGTASATIRLVTRELDMGVPRELAAYTLGNVLVTSYRLTAQPGTSFPRVDFTLDFLTIASTFKPIGGDAVEADWNRTLQTTSGGAFGPTDINPLSPPDHTLTSGDRTIGVQSYGWSMSGGSALGRLAGFTLTASLSGASALFALAATGTVFGSMQLISRRSDDTPYLTYTLTNVRVASYTVAAPFTNTMPDVHLLIEFDRIDMDFRVTAPTCVTISDALVVEGNTGTTAALFTVRLTEPRNAPILVSYATSNGSATAPGDYQANTGTLTFAPMQTRQTLTILVNGDTAVEPNETFAVQLSVAAPVQIADGFGQCLILDDDFATLVVMQLAPTPTGFTAYFNRPINPVGVNLYDAQGALGPADVTMTGTATGPVRGSLVLDPSNTRLTFIRTGGLLPADSYTVTLRSAVNAFRDGSNNLLDGDRSGAAGGNFVTSFSVAASSAVVVSVPDFVRGPGQAVNVPAVSAGIPLRLSNGNGVRSLIVVLRHDPARLSITAATVGAMLPPGAAVSLVSLGAGVTELTFTSPTPLTAGAVTIATLTANVPLTTATAYATKQILDLTDMHINADTISTLDDDSIHVVAYSGDASGNGRYSSLDAQRTLRVAVGLDSGFAAYQLADPALIADITGNGLVTSADSTRILQEAIGLDRAEIPPIPGGVPAIVPAGPDPLLRFGRRLRGRPGNTVTVPLLLAPSDGLEAADLAISYDTARLEVIEVRRGRLTRDFDLFAVNVDTSAGAIHVGLGRSDGPIQGRRSGSVLEVVFRIRADAPAGQAILNLRQQLGATTTQLNEGGLVLGPAPSDQAGDVLDGRIDVRRRSPFRMPTLSAGLMALKKPRHLPQAVDAIFAEQGSERFGV